jgi:FkbM family methyltransferase
MILQGARRLGLEDRLAWAWSRAAELRRSPEEKRNLLDDQLVQVVAASVLRPDSNCIDIGANEGRILAMFSEIAPHGHHIAYEPVPWLADRLEARFPAVEVRRCAVADEVGATSFVVHKTLESRSSIRSVGYAAEETETITVPVETLDASLPEDYAPAMVKIDVEGAEQLVLAGARELVARHRPLVLFEYQPGTAQHYGVATTDVYDLVVGDLGMRIFDMSGLGPYTPEGFRAVTAERTRWNFLATPNERVAS